MTQESDSHEDVTIDLKSSLCNEIIDRVSDEFEQCWHAGERRRIEEFLERVDPLLQPRLFRELVTVEIQLRRAVGERPCLEEYEQRFPEGNEMILTALQTAVDAPAEGLKTGERSIKARNSSFGDYELLMEIGRGGMGVVYKARQISLNRTVAIKLLRARQLASPQDIERFRIEAEAAATLCHPAIVPVFEAGEHGGQHFFSMAFIEGCSLREKIATGPLPPRQAAEIVRKIAVALVHAHEKGVIHRDLKPSNILLDDDDQPYVSDFGLAKRIWSDVSLTESGQVLGTPSYMPPEQAIGLVHEIGPASDIYSLGAVLYELLTGRPPFQAASILETLALVKKQDPVSLRRLNHRIDRDLETICLKCLDKTRKARYSSAQELADELGRYLAGEPVVARPVGTFGRVWRWYRRNSAAPAQIAGGSMTFCAILFLLWNACGSAFILMGLDKFASPIRAILEIALLSFCVYLPMLFIGVRTLNGGRIAVWAGMVLSGSGLVMSITIIKGGFQMQLASGRLQLASLFLILCTMVFLTHLVAIVSLHANMQNYEQTSAPTETEPLPTEVSTRRQEAKKQTL